MCSIAGASPSLAQNTFLALANFPVWNQNRLFRHTLSDEIWAQISL